jgi:hypothetical protein
VARAAQGLPHLPVNDEDVWPVGCQVGWQYNATVDEGRRRLQAQGVQSWAAAGGRSCRAAATTRFSAANVALTREILAAAAAAQLQLTAATLIDAVLPEVHMAAFTSSLPSPQVESARG